MKNVHVHVQNARVHDYTETHSRCSASLQTQTGKKMKTANFKKLLLSIKDKDMQQHRELINEAFESWKGNLEQLDDVCVIGVRI